MIVALRILAAAAIVGGFAFMAGWLAWAMYRAYRPK